MEAAERSRLTLATLLAAALLVSCTGPDAVPAANAEPASMPSDLPDQPPTQAVIEVEPEREPPPPPQPVIACAGPAKQGGAIVCKANPGASISLDGKAIATADDQGIAVVGLRRDAPAEVRIGVRLPDYDFEASTLVEVATRKDTVSKFTMECGKISAQTPEQKRHAEVSWVKKDKALKAFSSPVASLGFAKPAEGPYSSPFGAVRTYLPKTKDCEGSTSVHNGQDIAIPTGTEIHAPMGGTVLLADPDLYYEGGAVFLDHGHGLVSVMMHMSRIDVADGDVVQQGDVLGLSGATGRVTGPHLHWAIKFRNVHSEDRGTDIWLDPVLMMDLAMPD